MGVQEARRAAAGPASSRHPQLVAGL